MIHSLLLMFQLFPHNSPILLGQDMYEDLKTESCSPSAKSDHELLVCAYHRFVGAEKSLQSAYDRSLAHFKGVADQNPSYDIPDISTMLRDSQRAWVRSRESYCTVVGASWGSGSGRASAEFACLAGQAEERTRVLDALMP